MLELVASLQLLTSEIGGKPNLKRVLENPSSVNRHLNPLITGCSLLKIKKEIRHTGKFVAICQCIDMSYMKSNIPTSRSQDINFISLKQKHAYTQAHKDDKSNITTTTTTKSLPSRWGRLHKSNDTTVPYSKPC